MRAPGAERQTTRTRSSITAGTKPRKPEPLAAMGQLRPGTRPMSTERDRLLARMSSPDGGRPSTERERLSNELQRRSRESIGPGGAGGGTGAGARALDAAAGSGGTRLPGGLRNHFESLIGADLGRVRIHTGSASEAALDGLGARACTRGRDIHFGAGEYDPHSEAGQRLLAHEVAHVVQQSRGGLALGPGSVPGQVAEREADVAAEAMMAGHEASWLSAVPEGALQMKEDDKKKKDKPAAQDPDQELIAQAGGTWTVDGVIAILNNLTDRHVLESVEDMGVTVIRFDTAFDTYKYNDGHKEEQELTGLRGNTVYDPPEIRIRAGLTNQEAAAVLVHEMGHMVGGDTDTNEESLQQEIDVRIDTEDFRLRQGMSEQFPGARKDGKVDAAAITKAVTESQHYNPKDRKWVKRRWVGEQKTKGWLVPPVVY